MSTIWKVKGEDQTRHDGARRTVIDGTESIEAVGDRLFAEILKQHDFGIWRIGPTF